MVQLKYVGQGWGGLEWCCVFLHRLGLTVNFVKLDLICMDLSGPV